MKWITIATKVKLQYFSGEFGSEQVLWNVGVKK